MLGGYPSAEAANLNVPSRDILFQRITSLGEGAIFRQEDITQGDPELVDDFTALRGYDYFHLADGNLVGVVETQTLRRMPRLNLLVKAYEEKNGVKLVETGDWTAWRNGMKRWEPLKGHRYYTTGEEEFLSYGRYMKIQILPAPSWLYEEGQVEEVARAAFDTFQDKEAEREILDWAKTKADAFDLLSEAADYLEKIDEAEQKLNQQDEDTEEVKVDTTLAECVDFLRALARKKSEK